MDDLDSLKVRATTRCIPSRGFTSIVINYDIDNDTSLFEFKLTHNVMRLWETKYVSMLAQHLTSSLQRLSG